MVFYPVALTVLGLSNTTRTRNKDGKTFKAIFQSYFLKPFFQIYNIFKAFFVFLNCFEPESLFQPPFALQSWVVAERIPEYSLLYFASKLKGY